MGIMTHSESVQPLQSVKLVYQPCSRSRAAWKTDEIIGSYWYSMMLMLMFNHYCHMAIVYDHVGTGA